MGALIGSLQISEEEYTNSLEMLNEMLEDKLEITAEPYPEFNFASESEMEDGFKRVYFQHVIDEVVERVKENNPDWFDMHKEVFFELFDSLFPTYSSKCKSSDSEAMHIIEILNHVNGFLNANIKVYVGDGHTTSKVVAAMSYLSYHVIAAGTRTKIKPVELTKSMKEEIKANLELLNKVGKLLRLDGEYGKFIASKEHIHINGMNIRALLDDSGSIILTKVIREDPHIDDLCNSIETSHRSKRIITDN